MSRLEELLKLSDAEYTRRLRNGEISADEDWEYTMYFENKRQEEREAKWAAMSEEERKRIKEELSDPFYYRISCNLVENQNDDEYLD